jgi:hypothetical protein
MSSRGTRISAEPEVILSERVAVDFISTAAGNPAEYSPLGGDAVHCPAYDELLPLRAKTGMDRHKAGPAKIAMVPSRPAPGLLERARTSFSRHWIAAAVGVGFLLALGMLVRDTTRSPVYLTAPVPNALPGTEATLTERDAVALRAVTIQDGPVPTIPSIQPALAVMAVESAVACTDRVAALGLCPSEPERTQPATQSGSSTDLARWSAKDHATGGCKTGVAALGLCEK